jgi:NADH-quinone oxidoreductase subunit N
MTLAVVAMLVLLVDFAIPREKKAWTGLLSLFGIFIAFTAVPGLWGVEKTAFGGMLIQDNYALFFKIIFMTAAALIILISMGYLKEEGVIHAEYYPLILLATMAMMLMASAGDLLMLYLSLETMAVTIYVLVGFLKRDKKSSEAALKYLLLGAFTSGILLYGIALIYGLTGTTNLQGIAQYLSQANLMRDPTLMLAMIFLVAGFGFKIAAVPFHMWAPDVYEGAPTAITAFMSIAPKAAGFAILVRVFMMALPSLRLDWVVLFYTLSVLTMTLGNVVAIAQKNIKRMLAYSSIAHAGYILIGLVVGDQMGISAVLFYLLTYLFMNLGAFAVVILLCRRGVKGDNIEDFRGLAYYAPWASAAMLVFLLSLTGIPPTAGFVGKYYLFAAAIKSKYYVLAVIAALNSAISLYYYMRVVMVMYMSEAPEKFIAPSRDRALMVALVVALVFTFWLGILPGAFYEFARASVWGFLGS